MKKMPATTNSIIICSLIAFSTTNTWGDCGRLSGTITNLPPVDGYDYQPSGLNGNGQIAGYIYNLDWSSASAFIYTAGAIQQAGTFGGPYSFAYAINSSGQAVGNAGNADGSSHAMMFDGTNLRD